MKERKLRRAVVKEELIALTGDWMKAVILNQLIYWSERVSDFDAFIEEERARNSETSIELTNGWIYKSAKELSSEVMAVSEDNARTKLDELVKSGLVDRRTNPNYAWDRTYQYRVNIKEIQARLQKLGLSLEKYPLVASANSIPLHAECIPSQSESIPSRAGALSETTTETTSKTTASPAPSSGRRGRSVPKTGYRDEDIERVAVGDENGNEKQDAAPTHPLEHLICQSTHSRYLSVPQKRKLRDPVQVVPPGGHKVVAMGSPVEEYDGDPEGFADYVRRLSTKVGGGRPSRTDLINAVRNYDRPGTGWMHVKAASGEYKPRAPEENLL